MMLLKRSARDFVPLATPKQILLACYRRRANSDEANTKLHLYAKLERCQAHLAKFRLQHCDVQMGDSQGNRLAQPFWVFMKNSPFLVSLAWTSPEVFPWIFPWPLK